MSCISCQQECISRCLEEHMKAVKDTNSWCSLASVGTLLHLPMPSDATRRLGPASLLEYSLGSSVLGLRGTGPGLVSGWFQKAELHPPLQLPHPPTRSLILEQGRMAVPREKTMKITVTPESFLASWHSTLLLPLGYALAFG